MHPILVPQTKPGGIPHRLLEVILEIFEVLGGLGRFGRMLGAGLHGYGRSGRALERLLDGLGGLLGDLGEVLGVMLGPEMAAKSWKLSEKVLLQEAEGSTAFFWWILRRR